jgi:RNA polymerase sigma-70 factor (ECF subfamily)
VTVVELGVEAGRVEDFAIWVQPHLPAMTRLAARLVSRSDAEDVVQEALVRAWRRRSTYEAARGSELAWLLAIVADRARRHRTRARTALNLVDVATEPDTRDLDLERALDRLGTRQRLAVDLHYFVGLDVLTCAQVMGCAEGTVKATLHQARERLRGLLAEGAGT